MNSLLSKVSVSFLTGMFLAAPLATAAAQESAPEQIYLDELGTDPPPKIVKQDTVQDKYEDGTPRSQRGIARLSDDQVISHGKYVESYRDGQKYAEGQFDMGLHTGQWKYWHPNGQLCKTVEFKAGKPHGSWEIFRADGTLEASKSYENGLRSGKWSSYFEDGKQPKVEMEYVDGMIEGERFTYYSSGQVRQKITFVENQMHGPVVNWDEDGSKLSEMTFEKGQLSGKPKYFRDAENSEQ